MDILFRAQTEQGKWIYGSYIFYHDIDNPNIIHHRFIDKDYEGGKYTKINGNTVGQYTNVKDKNDDKIFVGDLIKLELFYDFNAIYEVKLGKYMQDGSLGEYASSECIGFYMEFYDWVGTPYYSDDEDNWYGSEMPDYEKVISILGGDTKDYLEETTKDYEIIGNIFDGIVERIDKED